jgi:hypothetical protein
MKCNRCNKAIDSERDAFVTMPNAEQCGYQRRRPTVFAHARCFEKDVKTSYELELKSRDEMMVEIGMAPSEQLSLINLLTNVCQILDVVKQEWGATNAWSDWDQSVRDGISEYLKNYYEGKLAAGTQAKESRHEVLDSCCPKCGRPLEQSLVNGVAGIRLETRVCGCGVQYIANTIREQG